MITTQPLRPKTIFDTIALGVEHPAFAPAAAKIGARLDKQARLFIQAGNPQFARRRKCGTQGQAGRRPPGSGLVARTEEAMIRMLRDHATRPCRQDKGKRQHTTAK